jgi:TRAP-type C4-dicarboxylate transport system permease small subunit
MPSDGPRPPQDDEDLGSRIEAATRALDFDDPDRGASRIDRAVNQLAEVAGVGVFVTIVGIVFFNAFGRYALQFTFIWGDELVLSLLPWLGMLGMFLAIRRRQVIRIDYFIGLFPPILTRTLSIVASLFAAGIFTYLAIVSIQYVSLFGSDRLLYLRLEKGWFMAAMVGGPALAAIAYVIVAIQDFRTTRRERS